MKLIIQVVEKASITINNKKTKSIGKGLLVYFGVGKEDCDLICHSELVSESKKIKDPEINSGGQKLNQKIEKIANKLQNLQLFVGENDKINTSLKDIDGEILLVSNFTIYGKNKKGNKIDFLDSGKFEESKKIYDILVKKLKQDGVKLQTGEFGAYMEIESKNCGPLNYVLGF